MGPGPGRGRLVAVGGRRGEGTRDALPAQWHRRTLWTGLWGTLLLICASQVGNRIFRLLFIR